MYTIVLYRYYYKDVVFALESHFFRYPDTHNIRPRITYIPATVMLYCSEVFNNDATLYGFSEIQNARQIRSYQRSATVEHGNWLNNFSGRPAAGGLGANLHLGPSNQSYLGRFTKNGKHIFLKHHFHVVNRWVKTYSVFTIDTRHNRVSKQFNEIILSRLGKLKHFLIRLVKLIRKK